MLENITEKFMTTASEDSAFELVNYCRTNSLHTIGYIIGTYLAEKFPHLWQLINEVALCSLIKKDYVSSYDLFSGLSQYNLTLKDFKVLEYNMSYCVPYIADRYNYYNYDIVSRLTKKVSSKLSFVTVTMTTCKRYKLFEQTINTFLNCCEDLDKVDQWLCIDDNSSENDRIKMQEKYPFFKFYFKSEAEKGHAQSMNLILKYTNTPYIFHLEDDWKFFHKRKYISECLEVLQSCPKFGQCVVNKNYAETQKDFDIIGGILATTKSGLKFYIHESALTEKEQEEFLDKYPPGRQCAYWPHFSLRPSLMRKTMLNELAPFKPEADHFEKEFAFRYVSKGYLTTFLNGINSLHIGRLTTELNDETKLNAYILNGERQFNKKNPVASSGGVKTEKVAKKVNKNVVINLDRRTDRLETFLENEDCRVFEKFPAIDGKKLKPNPRLSLIFDDGDFNMRVGIVGCAMSHFILLSDLANCTNGNIFCICEDDAILVDKFHDKVQDLLETTPNDWDFIMLGYHCFKKYEIKNEGIPKAEKWIRTEALSKSPGGTTAYLVNSSGARKFLDYINQVGMTNAIDTMIQKSADKLNIYYSTPRIAYAKYWNGENDFDTDIQLCYDSLNMDINERFLHELTFYKDHSVQTVVDSHKIEEMCNEKLDKIVFYKLQNDLFKLVEPLNNNSTVNWYTLEDKYLVIVPKDISTQYGNRFVHLFKDNDRYSVSEALVYV